MSVQFNTICAYLLDLDGTLYLGPNLFPETPRFLQTLKGLGLRRLFLTNNSFRSTRQYLYKLRDLGIDAEKEEILTSGWATIHYLLHETSFRKVYLLGSPGLKDEFIEAGIHVVNPTSTNAERAAAPDAVVLGFDQSFTYDDLRIASWFLREGAPYIATHPDKVCPTEHHPIPDTGAMIEYLAAATGRRPTVIGKPEPTMIRAALSRTGTLPQETAMVGDRLYTDMRMAKEGGLASILVLSGETCAGDLENSAIRPDFIFENVGALADRLINEGI
ncbi:MAG: HAD-IIA family hydrolase [Candidatus Omnitrophota bacterium]|jgi:phosphoglycolate/pyridoxal phosphate phosphatase family enzyme|nr:MAG: HAD-IIA family hydrolase [Candidatus Omnitrophota bacterium]